MNRKILYGYQIQDGELTAHPKEAECVQRIFSLYLSGMAQHQIADTLNAEGLPYSAESPAWSRPSDEPFGCQAVLYRFGV